MGSGLFWVRENVRNGSLWIELYVEALMSTFVDIFGVSTEGFSRLQSISVV